MLALYLLQHYLEMFKNMEVRSKGVEKNNSDERKIIYEEIKTIVKSILTIQDKIEDEKEKKIIKSLIGKYSAITTSLQSLQPVNPNDQNGIPPNIISFIKQQSIIKLASINEIDKKEVVETYCDLICNYLKSYHKDLIAEIEGDSIFLLKGNDRIILISVGDNFLINKIIPINKFKSIYPIYSLEFYQKFWKKIVEAVRHFCYNNNLIIISDNKLPDVIDCNSSEKLKAWNISERKTVDVLLKFKLKENKNIWSFSLNNNIKTSQTNEDPLFKTMVQCIDPKLKSIFNKNGVIIQNNYIDNQLFSDIDFGHHTVRLKKEQYKMLT